MTLRSKTINRRYRLERRISLTDTSETWLGFDAVLHRAIAVSLPRQELLRDGPFLIEFLQRSRIATALHHRGIVAAFDSGEENDLPYLVTEYLGSESLTSIIRAESPFDIDDVAILIDQLANALDYAHQRGFVHGALSPDDIMVDDRGTAKILGLGLPIGSKSARMTSSRSSNYSIDDDVTALGAIAFEMLTGDRPGDLGAENHDVYLIDPDIPRNASDIVAIALGATRTRFASAGAFARSLSDWHSFDPGQFFVSPVDPVDWEVDDHSSSSVLNDNPSRTSNHQDIFPDDWLEEPVEEPPSQTDIARWLLIATLILFIAAGIIVWQNTSILNQTVATLPLPAPVEALAQLSGF